MWVSPEVRDDLGEKKKGDISWQNVADRYRFPTSDMGVKKKWPKKGKPGNK